MSTSQILTSLFSICAAVGAVRLYFAYRSARRLAQNGGTTTGTVTQMEDLRDEGWLVHVRYEVGGRAYGIRVGSNGGYRVGEAVDIRYLVADPGTADIDSRGRLWAATIGALTLMLVFAGAAGLLFGLGRAFSF